MVVYLYVIHEKNLLWKNSMPLSFKKAGPSINDYTSNS